VDSPSVGTLEKKILDIALEGAMIFGLPTLKKTLKLMLPGMHGWNFINASVISST
jgi:hypothetical protein